MIRRKYRRPIIDIFTEVVSQIYKTMQARTVTANADGTQTLYVCDTLYAQRGFSVTISGTEYEITAFDPAAGTITVSAGPAIERWTIFELYPVYFYSGTPSTTQTELSKIDDAFAKTPMIWAWERWKEKTIPDMLVDREAFMELFALTQPPKKLAQMTRAEKEIECVVPMRRLMELMIDVMYKRTDLFDTEDLQYEFEDQEDFGIVARSKGVERALFTDNLSGTGIASLIEFMAKDSCPCPEPYIPTPTPPPSARVTDTGDIRVTSTGDTRVVSE